MSETFDLAEFARLTVLRGIDAADSPADMKARIMLARQCGFLSDAECEEWIIAKRLEEA